MSLQTEKDQEYKTINLLAFSLFGEGFENVILQGRSLSEFKTTEITHHMPEFGWIDNPYNPTLSVKQYEGFDIKSSLLLLDENCKVSQQVLSKLNKLCEYVVFYREISRLVGCCSLKDPCFFNHIYTLHRESSSNTREVGQFSKLDYPFISRTQYITENVIFSLEVVNYLFLPFSLCENNMSFICVCPVVSLIYTCPGFRTYIGLNIHKLKPLNTIIQVVSIFEQFGSYDRKFLEELQEGKKITFWDGLYIQLERCVRKTTYIVNRSEKYPIQEKLFRRADDFLSSLLNMLEFDDSEHNLSMSCKLLYLLRQYPILFEKSCVLLDKNLSEIVQELEPLDPPIEETGDYSDVMGVGSKS